MLTYRYRYTPTARERQLLRAGYSTATYTIVDAPKAGHTDTLIASARTVRELPEALPQPGTSPGWGSPRLHGGEAAHASPDPGSAAVKAGFHRRRRSSPRRVCSLLVAGAENPLPVAAVARAEPAGLDGQTGPAAASTPARSASPRPSPDVRVTPSGGAAGAAGGCPAAGLPGTAPARQPPGHPPRRPRARAPNPHRSVGGPPRSTCLSLCWPFRLGHFPQSRLRHGARLSQGPAS